MCEDDGNVQPENIDSKLTLHGTITALSKEPPPELMHRHALTQARGMDDWVRVEDEEIWQLPPCPPKYAKTVECQECGKILSRFVY